MILSPTKKKKREKKTIKGVDQKIERKREDVTF